MLTKSVTRILIVLGMAFLTACGDTGSQSSNPSYTFETLAGPTVWTQLKRTIVVDSQDQVYVTSGTTIFRINGNGPSMYLSSAAIAAAIGNGTTPSMLEITSIDVGPDNKLYILEAFRGKILVSNGPGDVTVHRELSGLPGFPHLLGVIDADNILLINLYDGLWQIKGSGNTLLYDSSLVLGGTNNSGEGLAVRFDGSFAYLPGIGNSPLVGGKSDGSGVGILLSNSIDVGLKNPWMFSGIGRNPAGGYLVNINGARIARCTGTGIYELVPTRPNLDELAISREMDSSAFLYSPLAAGASGNIYILSDTTVYVAKKNQGNFP